MFLLFFVPSSEQEMFKEEIKSLQSLRGKLLQRVQELEDEVKTARDEAEKLARSNKSDDEVRSLKLRFGFVLVFFSLLLF